MNHRYIQLMRCRWAIVVLAVFVLAASAVAAGTFNRPAYVPNQLMVRFVPGTTQAERDAAIEQLGAKLIRPVALANTYLLELAPTRGQTVESAVTRATQITVITDAAPNPYLYPLDITPNDEMWSRLWGMRMINMPKAWDLEKGSASVVVAVVDTGVSPTHPDLQGRVLQGRDVADNDNDASPSPDEPVLGYQMHGTHVAGTIAAQGNNTIGVVGVCWDGVKILPIKIYPNAGVWASTGAELIDGLDYALHNGAHVVNMSIGGPIGTVFMHDKLKELYGAGIVQVAAAGNDGGGPVSFPAAFEECIAVSALQESEELAPYSNVGPEVDIAAPGGYDVEDGPGAIWSTAWTGPRGNHYAGIQGTSMATPHVSGAAALLLSYGIPASAVPGRLYRGARAPKVGVLDPLKYGHGVLDVYAALCTNAEINIISPEDGEVLDTETPTFKISTYLVRKETIKVYMDYPDANRDGTPDDLNRNIILDGATMDTDPKVQWDAATGMLTFTWPVAGQTSLAPGTHTFCVMGEPVAQAEGGTAKDWMVFFVQPHVVPAGRHLFSIPYPLPPTVTPYQLFGGTSFRLARYMPARNAYAKINYPGEMDDPEAWFGTGVHPHGETVDTPPAGLAFWVELTSDTPIVVDGVTDKSRAYDVTLTRGVTGWNMLGNPFPFAVPWESVKIVYQGKTLTLKDAVTAGWLRPALYRYTKSGFTFQTPPDAVLVPWEGHWIKILPGNPDRPNDSMVLIIPPIESGAIVESPRSRATAVSADAWSLRLEARAAGVMDSHNFIGINSRAADGFDPLDVEKPPMIDGYVELSFVHRDWGTASGRYASDFRSNIGTGKTWEFEVATDMANKEVSIAWPDISSAPKQYNLVLEDLGSGSRTYMRTRSVYTYNSGATPGIRRFRLRVEPSDSGRLMVTNVAVSRTKGSSISIGYTISRDARVVVRVRDYRNKLVRTLDANTTRAAGLNTVHWDCAFDNGKPVPSGLYLAEIVATGPDGEVAKRVSPILVR